MHARPEKKWHFWIDRGGTFTDIVAFSPEGRLLTHKLLSESEHYTNAGLQGIQEVLQCADIQQVADIIAEVRMGTTLGTNALLERKGARVALLITTGFSDALRIGYQNRPDLFALHIVLPEPLYEQVIAVKERYTAEGEELQSLDLNEVYRDLQAVYQQGIHAVAIVLMHGYRFPKHEQQITQLAQAIGFEQISVSHEVSPLPKLICRGDTTVVDAYLTPILRDYMTGLAKTLGRTPLFFMQSHGGLAHHTTFRGRDCILSGPAAGVVGAVQTALQAGFTQLINFDMGGTSTDVSHYAGEYERDFDTTVAGVRLQTPIMRIHTVAAGGGSICYFDGARCRVGPESAGAHPGPACYGKGGPLTVTDCNVMLNKLQAAFFPKVLGQSGQAALDAAIVQEKFTTLAATMQQATGKSCSATEVAEGFLTIAVENMAQAIKKISVQRGYDVAGYTLCCFGGAGGQHACLVADALGMKTIFIHPQAGVLSALGMGLADVRTLHEQAIEAVLSSVLIEQLKAVFATLEKQGRHTLQQQQISNDAIHIKRKVHLRYAGTDTTLLVTFADEAQLKATFTEQHQQHYGFIRPKTPLVVEALSLEAIGRLNTLQNLAQPIITAKAAPIPLTTVMMTSAGQAHATPVYACDELLVGQRYSGPAILVEKNSTIIVEPHWQAEMTEQRAVILTRQPVALETTATISTTVDPIRLEIFNNLFMSIAEQMGATLANTAYSVNIKERLDFSCALFDQAGQLIANAPHVPVHLGSMGDSVQVVRQVQDSQPGDVFVLNNPYHGGTHLPDVTVVTPVFLNEETPLFYLASRGHHADIGGITPGSMPPHSQTLNEEGIVIDVFKCVVQGQLREAELHDLLTRGSYPVRNIAQNLADLHAQIAANATGVRELHRMVQHFGLAGVKAYMQHVQNNAEHAVRRLLRVLQPGQFRYFLDNGAVIAVQISIDRQQQTATIDFSGTSSQQTNNFNAPAAVCKAAVLYVFRTLVKEAIPMNAGCLKPLKLVIPPGSLLNPTYPAAVVAGNVEISQCIVDALYGALNVMAASQGTMNNFAFGNAHYQYYETICGGSGAGPGFHGTAAVQTHMTNSRLTDPEILEGRFPVLLEAFTIRHNSGGAGRYRGGEGIIRRIRFRESMTASIISSHRRIAPYGMAGGQPGQVGKNWIERINGTKEILAGTAMVAMQTGDVFVIETPGGGGYGHTAVQRSAQDSLGSSG